jgi:hypothetical protein
MNAVLPEWMQSDLGITVLMSGVSLLAVWVPFYRGLLVCGQALGATRRLDPGELARRLKQRVEARGEPLGLRMLRVLGKSLREADGQPAEFVVDASRQYVAHEYDASYARPISMYANILPPLGFIGTTCGMLVLFLSMRMASDSLEIGALALALTSSIFALICFAVLEAVKIRLYGRMLAGLDDALAFYRTAGGGVGGR